MIGTTGLCDTMSSLMRDYAEAALAHSDLVHNINSKSRALLAAALTAREKAWRAWEDHVAAHGCVWPGNIPDSSNRSDTGESSLR